MTRLMCSQDRTEVELVKKELFRAGIPSEIRNNPLAQALRVTRVELWVQDERDYFNASKLYTGIQARMTERSADPVSSGGAEASQECIELDDARGGNGGRRQHNGNGVGARHESDPRRGELEQASSLLEKEIEELLERESELARTCSSLRGKVQESGEALTKAQAELARETDRRLSAEKKQAEEVSGLRSALEVERGQRSRAEGQLESEKCEWHQQLKSRDEALRQAQMKLEAKTQQLQVQQTAVVELRKELVSRELQCQEQEKALSKSRAETLVEREARITAEERAERTAAAQRALEQQLAGREELQQQVQASVANLNSLRTRLLAKKATRCEARP